MPQKHTLYDLLDMLYTQIETASRALPFYTLSDEQKSKLIQEICKKFDPLEHVMGTEEAAEKWGITPKHVNTLINQGKIRSKRIGRSHILDRNEEYERERFPQ